MNEILLEIGSSTATVLVLWYVLGNHVFKPFFALIDEREARTTGDEHDAVDLRNRQRALQAQIEEKLRDARIAGVMMRDDRVNQAKKEGQAIIDREAQQAAIELKKAEAQIAELKAKAQAEVPLEASKLAKLVASRALATEQSRTIH